MPSPLSRASSTIALLGLVAASVSCGSSSPDPLAPFRTQTFDDARTRRLARELNAITFSKMARTTVPIDLVAASRLVRLLEEIVAGQ